MKVHLYCLGRHRENIENICFCIRFLENEYKSYEAYKNLEKRPQNVSIALIEKKPSYHNKICFKLRRDCMGLGGRIAN